eukprot:evm.model.NODE_27169_length_92994_cov_27.080458.13
MGNAQGGGKGGGGGSDIPIPAGAGGAALSSGGCPIKGKSASSAPPPVAPAAAAPGCPVKGKGGNKAMTGTVYNVYSQPIDPTNQMPANANNKPAPGQVAPLSTDRVPSRIPKGGTEAETWTYPSPQMFWNALVRKGKAEGATEEDMAVVVAIHNNMNENTWRKVCEWEALHAPPSVGTSAAGDDEAPDPRLSRFLGKPDDISPKAWFKSLFGHPLPFDRHDWVVQRPDGTEVRYIIDYYHDDAAAKDNKIPQGLHDKEAVKSISVDVRPALDSVHAVIDRGVRMPISRAAGNTPFQPLPFFWAGSKDTKGGHSEEAKKRIAEAAAAPATAFAAVASGAATTKVAAAALPAAPVGGGKEEEIVDMTALSKQVHLSCADHFAALRRCKNEADCARTAVGLSYCMGSLLCKPETAAFDQAMAAQGSGDKHDAAIEAAFGRMRTCLDGFESKAGKERAAGGER